MSEFKYMGMVVTLVIWILSLFFIQSLSVMFDATIMSLLNAVLTMVFFAVILIMYRLE